MNSPLIEMTNVSKAFYSAAGTFNALRDVSIAIERGAFTMIVGQSGSGKSTLLSLLAGIESASSGTIRIADVRVDTMNERALTKWRGTAVGIVFQFFQLMPTLTAIENVMLPMDFTRRLPFTSRRPRALALLEELGVADQAFKLPSTLSGGQQQRVAAARALANEPLVLLADEPTGNLDSQTAGSMLEIFAGLAKRGQTVVMVTHDQSARRFASQTIVLADGRVVSGADSA